MIVLFIQGKMPIGQYFVVLICFILISCSSRNDGTVSSQVSYDTLNRARYNDKLAGFWLGQSIANWSGLVTEMDKIGDIGEIKTGPFYTRADWNTPDHPSIWAEGLPSDLSETIDYVLIYDDSIWGSDDDTDIEYIYQELLLENNVTILSGTQIREGWLKHIKTEEENYLWVSNQKAYDLMLEGMEPPLTSLPKNNEHYRMIDAQLTTEIFGLLAPGRPETALKMAELPILTVAREDAKLIAEFYIIMYSLAVKIDPDNEVKTELFRIADVARQHLPDTSYMADMYDLVKDAYFSEMAWESVRDSLYIKYQVNQEAGYDITSYNLYCNGCFAAGINFGASIISLYYGEADLEETIKIGMLTGWDSDNPTATWGGLLGFIYGEEQVRNVFGTNLSDSFNIHRTRINFPDNGRDSFNNMARKGIEIIDKVVLEQLAGVVDEENNLWLIPNDQ